MRETNNLEIFSSLLKSGLWEQDLLFPKCEGVDFGEIYRLAEEQSVLGLITASFDHVADVNVPYEMRLVFVGSVVQVEQRNRMMNQFVADLVDKLQIEGIKAVLVKGQGVAQCYERPLWRACGDVDLLLSKDDFYRAEEYLRPFASKIDEENPYNKHLAMTIDLWSVELHGTLRGLLKNNIDKGIDKAQEAVFKDGNVRSWMNKNTRVFLPGADEDVIFVFSHLLQHFFKEGICLRQICDWCRLLWTYKETIDRSLLEMRLRQMGIMTEWKAFAAVAIDYLGMPVETMPLYSPSKYWSRKGNRILKGILNDNNVNAVDFHLPSNYLNRKTNSFWQHTKAGMHHFVIFPLDTVIVWINMIIVGVKVAVKSN